MERGISTILAGMHRLISGNVVGQCLDSGHSFLIGCCDAVLLPYLLLWHSVERPLCEQRIAACGRRSRPFPGSRLHPTKKRWTAFDFPL